MLNIELENVSNLKVEKVNNISRNKEEIKISNGTYTVSIDNKTGDLVAYDVSIMCFPKSNVSTDDAKKIANEIYDNLKIENKKNYKLANISQFDEELWRVEYVKEYNGIKNPGEKISFSFSPQSKEIYNLVILRSKYEKNEVKISKEQALNIAQSKIKLSRTPKIKEIRIEIVRPNYCFAEVLDNSEYIEEKNMRKAYVIILENDSEIYVDVSNGEIIGGDMVLGESF